MQIRLPYVFDVFGIERKHRNPAWHHFVDWAWAELTEASETEAPVALKWIPGAPENTPMQTRWHDGRHWKTFGGLSDPKPTSILEGDDTTLICKALGYENPSSKKTAVAEFMSGKRNFNPQDFRQVMDVRREEGLDNLFRSVRRLLSVDGVLHYETVEPRYTVRFHDMQDGEQRPSAFIEIKTEWNDYSLISYPHFRLDRLADIRDYVRDRGEHHAIRHVDHLETFLPQSIQFDGEAFALVSICRRIAGLTRAEDSFESIRRMDAEVAREWFTIRDAVSGKDDLDKDALEELAESLTIFSRGLRGQILQQVEDVLGRWSLRPMTFDTFAP